MKKVFKKLLARAEVVYKKIALRTDGPIFCSLFNIRSKILRKGVRFSFDKVTKVYMASSYKYSRYFYAKEQSWNCYKQGISERGRAIGEEYFLDRINFKSGDLVIDCGANVGDLDLYFHEKNIDIRYMGLEPSPHEFFCLKKNIPRGNALNIGLWSEDSHLKFFVSSENADSSFIEPSSYTEIVTIPTKRLDSILDESIKLLKIEAEGAEPEALLGCERLLHRIDYISADLGFERGILKDSTLAPVTNYLLSNGFELLCVGYPRVVALYKQCKLPSD